MKSNLGPSDFDPYRAEFSNCNCLTCRNVSYANSGHGNLAAAAAVLLAELKAGTHRRVEQAEYIAEIKMQRAKDVAEACVAGASGLHMYGLYRGYSGGLTDKHYYEEPHLAEFMVGTGIGLTPGRHEAANARLMQRRAEIERERELKAKKMAETDARYTCTYFRVAGEVCTAHAEQLAATG